MGGFAAIRIARNFPGVPAPIRDIDIVIVREINEDLYVASEYTAGDDTAIALKVITRKASEAVVRFAFEYARADNRKKVTAVHKANIMKFSDGLFLEAARQVAREYPDIEFEDRIVDNMTMQLVRRPQQFDVIVTPNLYGDIISDLCAGLVGGLGLAPGANIGDDYALFEATHGSAPKYRGLNKVNPMALMLSAVIMLRHIGEMETAEWLEATIAVVIAEGKNVTYDMKPEAERDQAVGTSQVADAVIEKLKE